LPSLAEQAFVRTESRFFVCHFPPFQWSGYLSLHGANVYIFETINTSTLLAQSILNGLCDGDRFEATMPSAWGLNVSLESQHGQTYTEYGTTQLLTRASRRKRLITTKVEARTSKKFRFRIQGNGPFLDLDDKDRSTAYSGAYAAQDNGRQPFIGRAPYALAVSILIDAKQLDSSMDVLYLTQDSPVMCGAKVFDSCNKSAGTNEYGDVLYKEHDWVSADVGNELRLAQLGFSSEGDQPVTKSWISDAENKFDKTEGACGNAGTIEVQLFRYIVQPQKLRPIRRGGLDSHSRSGDRSPGDAASCDGADTEVKGIHCAEADSCVTHTVEVIDRGEDTAVWNTIPGYYPDAYDEPYARYRFQYMSLSKLVKIGVANSDRSVVTPEQTKARIQRLSRAISAESSSKSKRKSPNEDDSAIITSPSASKRNKAECNSYNQGQRTILPLRNKRDSASRWLQSRKFEPQSTSSASESIHRITDIDSSPEPLVQGVASITLDPSRTELACESGSAETRFGSLAPIVEEAELEDEVVDALAS
jgi:hypothetical protein